MALSNSQYDELIRRYNARQIANQHRLEKRRATIYSKNPRLSQIDDEIAETSVSQAKRLIDGDTGALTSLKQRLTELTAEKNAILAQLGYKPEDLQLQYECPDCKDTGFINGKRCHCFLQASIDLVYTQSNIREILQSWREPLRRLPVI